MSARDLINAGAASSAAAIYVEDVFSTDTYTGNGLAVGYKDIVNNIPLNSSSAWWGAKWVGPTGGAFGTRVTADPSGNVYVCGYVVDTFGKSFIAKYNSSGTLQWQRIVSESSSSGYALGITSDSSGNVYITGFATDTLQHAYVIKYNTSGTLQWHRKLQNGSTRGRGIAVDSSGNVYVTGSFQSDSRVFTAKYNSSGTLQWQRQITPVGSEYAGYGVDIAADSSGNVYVTASIDSNHTFATILVLKYNTSGTLQWHRKAYQHNSYAGGIAVDSSGNVYIGGSIAVTSGSYPNNGTSGYIIKYNTSGTLQWQRKLSITPDGGGNIVGISVDSSGNSYVAGNCGDTSGGGVNVLGLIAKYNTSGTLQWQRYFRHGNGAGQNGGRPFGIYADSSNVYVTGSSDGSDSSGFVIKISQDGNTSGTVNGGTLSVGTATESAGTATDFAGTTTDTAGSATESAGTATDAVGNATSTTQFINAVDGGGLVWMKSRTNTGSPTDHALYDSVRGTTKELSSNNQSAQYTVTNGLTAFGANGFTIGAAQNINSTARYVAWTFRKQPKFFDVVTWTGNGTGGRQISHSLGSVPGCIIVKCLSLANPWYVYHRGANFEPKLNTTDAIGQVGGYLAFGTDPNDYSAGMYASPTSTNFTTGAGNNSTSLNSNGATYVAYLFAHDAGGFGASGTDNVISCGAFTTNGSGAFSVDLGWEPQWILTKRVSFPLNWQIYDTMRGLTGTAVSGGGAVLYPNLSSIEDLLLTPICPTPRGFRNGESQSPFGGNVSVIYIAIRRGPMRTPTTGTSVFTPATSTSVASGTSTVTTNFPVDLNLCAQTTKLAGNVNFDSALTFNRLTGNGGNLKTALGNAEENTSHGVLFDSNTTCNIQYWGVNQNQSGWPQISWNFRRAPGFFDVVCYTGTGSIKTEAHNLGVVPELMIVKVRNENDNWTIYNSTIFAANPANILFFTSGAANAFSTRFNSTAPTSTVFTVGTDTSTNWNTKTFVAYLFATCPGVSKVGSYTGNGSSQTINCGFTTGARFVLIKRTDSAGEWYVWDTARGIVAGNDPHLSLNTTAAQVTTNDSIDPNNTGFIVNQVSATNVNLGPVFSQINTSPIGSVEKARSLNGKLLLCGATDSSRTVAMVRSVEDATSYTVFTGSNSNYISDIAYGNGVYVVVGAQNVYTSKIYYSTNLSSWTEASHPSLTHGYQRVCFGNGVFVAAGNNNGGTGNYVAYSTDGITWNSTSVPNRATFLSFVNGQFVAFGSNMETIYTSTNGSTWSTISTGLGTFPTRCDIVYGAGVYVSMRSEGSSGRVVYSTNLSSWTEGQDLPYDSSMSIGYNSVTNRFLSLGRHVGNDLEYAHQSTVGSPTAFSEIMNIPATRTWLTPFIHNGGMVAPYNTSSSGAYTYDKPQYIYLAIA